MTEKELTPEELQVLLSWRAYKKVCLEEQLESSLKVDLQNPLRGVNVRLVLFPDVSGHIETSLVERNRRTRLTLGVLFEGGYFQEKEHTPEVWVRL